MKYFELDDLPDIMKNVIDEICLGGLPKEEFMETCDKIVISYYEFSMGDDAGANRAIDYLAEAYDNGANEQQMQLLMYVLTNANEFAYDAPIYVDETPPENKKKSLFDDYKPKLYLN